MTVPFGGRGAASLVALALACAVACAKHVPPPPPPPAPPPPPVINPADPPLQGRGGRGGGGGRGSSSASSRDHAVVPVFYATDRQPTTSQPLSYGPDREPSQSLHLGRFDVSIPVDVHEAGEIERPTIWTLWREDPRKHFIIVSRAEQTAGQFYADVSAAVAESLDRQAFVFIHGYNVSFEDAVYRTAQLSYDLRFDGASILYSWPSQGHVGRYLVDANNADWTALHLRGFLEDVATRTGANVIHVIGHSMGTRPLLHAMNRIAESSPESVRSRFSQIVLAAPDIDAGTFRELAAALPRAARQVTLYASSGDLALKASEKLQGYQRAGDTVPTVTIVPGVITIDASAVATGFLQHSYYGDVSSVIADMFYLLRQNLGPDRRANLQSVGQSPNRYWVFVR